VYGTRVAGRASRGYPQTRKTPRKLQPKSLPSRGSRTPLRFESRRTRSEASPEVAFPLPGPTAFQPRARSPPIPKDRHRTRPLVSKRPGLPRRRNQLTPAGRPIDPKVSRDGQPLRVASPFQEPPKWLSHPKPLSLPNGPFRDDAVSEFPPNQQGGTYRLPPPRARQKPTQISRPKHKSRESRVAHQNAENPEKAPTEVVALSGFPIPGTPRPKVWSSRRLPRPAFPPVPVRRTLSAPSVRFAVSCDAVGMKVRAAGPLVKAQSPQFFATCS
jgi:hypothetical protein